MALVGTLMVFLFLKEKLSGLKQELPFYLSRTVDIDCLEWWKIHATELPKWLDAAHLVLAISVAFFCWI